MAVWKSREKLQLTSSISLAFKPSKVIFEVVCMDILQVLLTMLETSRKANDSLSVDMVHLRQLTDLQIADIQAREGDLKMQVSKLERHHHYHTSASSLSLAKTSFD